LAEIRSPEALFDLREDDVGLVVLAAGRSRALDRLERDPELAGRVDSVSSITGSAARYVRSHRSIRWS
jgi:hypothetical protein